MRVVVLGGGVIGEAVAWDLTHIAPSADVTVVDWDAARLDRIARGLRVATRRVDLRDPESITSTVGSADVSVGALPSTLARPVIEHIAHLGGRHVDVSFLAEDPRTSHDTARASGAVIVYDCGVAPGLSHVLVGHALRAIASGARVRIDVGGLPRDPQPPFFYKAPFAAADVMEEYTRPARLVRNGRIISLPALSEPATVTVPGVGALVAFNTDGLRSLVDTAGAESMVERTLRYPGHLAAIRTLMDAGFFDATPIRVDGVTVSPRQVASALLFPRWQYAPDERDLTVLLVEAEGFDVDGRLVRQGWSLVDRPDRGSALSSMARTTGCPAAIVARWLAEGSFRTPGVHPPERLGLDGRAQGMLAALAARGIRVQPV